MSELWIEIRVTEILDDLWSQWFHGVNILPWLENGYHIGSILYGCLSDQAAIFGLLAQVRNLNLTLIEFRRIEKKENPNEEKN